MKKLIIFSLTVFLFGSCKKDDPNSLPAVVTGKWFMFSTSYTWQNKTKSAAEDNTIVKDTMVQMIFSVDKTLNYLELGIDIQNTNGATQIVDTFYQCHATYAVNGNNLTIENLVPKYKPYFTVKDYTFSIRKESQDTVLTINYKATVKDVLYSYELGLRKINF